MRLVCFLLRNSFAQKEAPAMSNSDNKLPLVERLRIVSLAEAARLAGISADGLRRHHSEKLIRLSPRRVGMRQGDALMIHDGNDPA
jgi:hypothetical protein